jgi:hypothetical protein
MPKTFRKYKLIKLNQILICPSLKSGVKSYAESYTELGIRHLMGRNIQLSESRTVPKVRCEKGTLL